MSNSTFRKMQHPVAWLAVLMVFTTPLTAVAQTKISYHGNRYSVQDDIKLGRQAAAEAEAQLPILRDAEVTDYVARVGRRLVASIPSEFQHPEFQYNFKVINAADINAFALPGGPMYVNRGMIEAARTEGEMAGVMAHELSHVALRHGTAQATKAQKYSVLAGVLGIGGAILGGPAGAAIGQSGNLVGVYFLKFSREYETEADLLGAQTMARAGYDPRDLANMFKTIERSSGSGGGGFLSDHPSPSDRYARINREAQYLRVENPIRDSGELESIQAKLRGNPRAATTAQIMQGQQRYPTENNTRYPENPPQGRVEVPSSRYRNYSEFGFLRVNIPYNWQEVAESNSSVWFSPQGAYGQYQGQSVFTHGVNFGVARSQSRDLERATQEVVNGLAQGSRNLRQSRGYARTTISGRNGLITSLTNVNEATGRSETVTLVTTQLRSGDLLYVITVAPQNEANDFGYAFNNIVRSIRLNE